MRQIKHLRTLCAAFVLGWPCTLMSSYGNANTKTELATSNSVESTEETVSDIGSTQSPDGYNVFCIQLSEKGVPTYTITRNGKELVSTSKLGIATDSCDFSSGLTFLTKETKNIQETYELPSGKTHIIANNCNETTYSFLKGKHKMQIVARCYNDGVAFRYIIDGSDSINITQESTNLEIPTFNKCWGEKYTSDYSTQYPARTWAETAALTDHKMCAPVLIQTTLGDDYWVLVTESAVLGSYSSSALISGEESEVGHFSYQPEGSSKVLLPFRSPWRTLFLGKLTDMVASNLNENLNDSCSIKDLSWIKPGLSSWDWGGQDGNQTKDINVVKDYIDLAYEMGWPYYTLDEGWAYSSYPLKDVIDYAASKGVSVIIWSHSHRFQNDEAQIRDVLSKWKAMGFAGSKIDFFDGDSQEQMQKYEKILRVAADLHMVINFHGCTKPTGLRRTFPNLLTSEAVYGGEQYFFNHLATPANHNVTLALTRNVIGAMDYTPTEFGRTDGVIRHTTTWSHQVALATIYESGIQTMSDCHENVIHNIAAPLLKILPASWDETKCLEASPDEYITMLRRKGDDWYLASISKEKRTISIPLSFLDEGDYTLQSYSDGSCPSDIVYSEQQVKKSTTLQLNVKATGGITLRISKNPFKQPKFTLVEAENGTRSSGATLEKDNDGNCSGGKFVGWLGRGQTVTDTVSVDEDGIYDCTIYYITQDTRKCYVKVNEGDKTYYSFKGNGFSWNSDGLAFKTVQVKLKKGSNTIQFGNDNGDAPNIDRFLISPTTAFNKVKVSAIEGFTSRADYTDEQPVSIKVTNNGVSKLFNVKVSYKVNDSDNVCEQIDSISPGETISYTFDKKADLSSILTYELQAWVNDDVSQRIEGDMYSVTFAHIPDGEPVSWISKGGSIDSFSAQQNNNEAASKIIDDDATTKWCETVNSQPWVIIKLPQSYYIQKFVIYDCKTIEEYKNVDTYDIYLNEDNSADAWQKVVSTSNRRSENIKVDTIAPVKAQYVKLVLSRPEGDNAIRLYGFDVYGTLDAPTKISSIKADHKPGMSGRYYNLCGQIVGRDYKGIVIHNGKKYVRP